MRSTTIFLFAAVCLNLAAGQRNSSQITINVDVPRAASGPVMGITTFFGWAVDSAEPIAALSASIDGFTAGVVTYGSVRPDVCALYPGPNCPEVGWSMVVDTTMLSSGAHTLTIKALSASGVNTSRDTPFVVANWLDSSANPIRVSVDSPSVGGPPLSGSKVIGGWALDDNSAISSISLSIDGISLGNAGYGAPRPDACHVFQNRPGCPDVGWDYALDTTAFSDGLHTLAVTCLTAGGQQYTKTVPFTVANLGLSTVKVDIDAPVAGSTISGTTNFAGWSLDDNSGIASVTVSVDGNRLGTAQPGVLRPDVCVMFPGRVGCPNVGWTFSFDSTWLGDGNHQVEVSARTTDGRQGTASKSFVIDNSALSSHLHVSIAAPATQNAILKGLVTAGGSAFDDQAAITSVTGFIDGAAFPVSYGLPSLADCVNDTAASNCPNAGWSLQFDSNQLANGSHNLTVLAQSADGRHFAAGRAFQVANWTSANPMIIDIDSPVKNKNVGGVASIYGWALHNSAVISTISVQVDGIDFGSVNYGDFRPDVCTVFPGRPNCPNPGWHGWVDTTALSNGKHTMTILATTTGGEHSANSVTFNVSNATRVNIDTPAAGGPPVSGVISVGGWAVNDKAAVSTVVISVDGVTSGNAFYGVARPDVCDIYAGRAGCPNVGWGMAVDTSALSVGTHTLQVLALTAAGDRGLETVQFTVSRQTGTSQLSPRGAGRILDQATWGPTPAALQELQVKGFDKWFNDQVNAPVSTYDAQPQLNADGTQNNNIDPVLRQFFQNAVNGQDQLRQRVAFALSEIWVVSQLEVGNASAFPPLLRIFQNRAFDNYENLIMDITLNPAMGGFLNMANDVKANASGTNAANENYARELMQLMTMGLNSLNSDGTLVLDENGNSLPSYTQSDVSNLARALTGWTYAPMPGHNPGSINSAYYLSTMIPVETNHDTGAKQLLGSSLAAGNSALQDVTSAVDTIFLQPSVGPFISRQLIQHLVTSNPSAPYVARVSAVFANDGQGVRGDLKAVVYAILTDPEARAGDNPGANDQSEFGHLREPVLFAANLCRGLNAALAENSVVFYQPSSLGQSLLRAPSVFSYFSPLFSTATGLSAPELQLYTTQTAARYADAVNGAVYGGAWDSGTHFNIAPFLVAAESGALIDLLNAEFMHGQMSTDLQNAINQALAPISSPFQKAQAALYMVLTSNDYLVIH